MPDPNRPSAYAEPGLQVYSPGWLGQSGFLVLRNPARILVAERVEDVPDVLEEASALAESGWMLGGFVTYEAAPAFDRAFTTHLPSSPLAWFGAYDAASVIRTTDPPKGDCFRVRDSHFSLSRETYRRAFKRIQTAIREGDVYQINFTAPLRFRLDGDPLALWTALRRRQPVPYGAYLDIGDTQILSGSPELFFERRGDRIVTRPMKGTVRRGTSDSEDEALASWLAADAKSRAENVMIVDLLRNDLSRCCLPGSVRVPKLFTTERYSTVIQMTSEVEGQLRAGCGTADLFATLFPCGSVTGAPKIEAVKRIRELESEPRGLYCGAIGFMHYDRAVFNVAIRSAVVRSGEGVLGIGSGIVADSAADAEYDECLLKAQFMTDLSTVRVQAADPPRLIETMRAEHGRIPLLELHANRLRTSAAALGYKFDEKDWRRRVLAAVDGAAPQKVRSLLGSDGAMEVSSENLASEKDTWRAQLADACIDADDLYRRHKTTRRTLYEAEWHRAASEGFDEVIFLNTRGEVAEGSRSNVVVRIDEQLYTPPITSGALPGVFRQHLVDTRGLRERPINPSDFEKADEVYLCNAVRGMTRAQIVLAPEKIRGDVTVPPDTQTAAR